MFGTISRLEKTVLLLRTIIVIYTVSEKSKENERKVINVRCDDVVFLLGTLYMYNIIIYYTLRNFD